MHPRLKILCTIVFVIAIVHFTLNDFNLSLPSTSISYGQSIPGVTSEGASTQDGPALNSSTLTASNQSVNGSLCPETPPKLVGPIRVWMDGPSMEKMEALYSERVREGGRGRPAECVARHKVAIVVPYRERETQLRIFLHNIHSFLLKQQLDYGIYIVEQVANQTFNRAKLMNVGFVEANKDYPWDCFVFHDVDLLPEDDRNVYSCPPQPRHMSVAVDKFNYQLPYGSLFGGISAMTREQVEKMNGFSNDYWGWGGEDDDLSTRATLAGYKISRYPANIARYKMIKHSHESSNRVNKCRYKLMEKTKRRWLNDGVSSLKYSLLSKEFLPLYTRVHVDLLYAECYAALKKAFPAC